MTLDSKIEDILTTTDITDTSLIARNVILSLTPDEYLIVLGQTMPAYVRDYIVKRRMVKPVVDVVPQVEKEYDFAPDDLLSDEGQQHQEEAKKKRIATVGSAKVAAIRTEWQRHFDDLVFNGSEMKKYGDFNADDLRGAAATLEAGAKITLNKAERYRNLADALGNKRIRDFKDSPLVGVDKTAAA